MKKNLLDITRMIPLFFLLACEDSLKTYQEETNRLNFVFDSFITDSTTHFTFVYEPDKTTIDTIWVEVSTMGYVTDYDRPIMLRQIKGTAEAGKHYIAFNDPSLADFYIIPAGKSKTKLPVIAKRDPSLKDTEVTLVFTFEENAWFKLGYTPNAIRKITITDQLAKPGTWNDWIDAYFGDYGTVKHRFMIDAAVPIGTKIDIDFFYNLVGDKGYLDFDMDLIDFWRNFFHNKLEEENAARALQNLDPLREEPAAGEIEGKFVEFPLDF